MGVDQPLDRFDLYELCAQAPEMEASFLAAVHGGSPRILREDFCGPGGIARAWVKLPGRMRRTAIVVDRDPEPLARAISGGIGGGRPDQPADPRITGVLADVLKVRDKADIIAALNFAVCELHERSVLVKYLRGVRASLKPRGVFVADLYGGADAYRPAKYTRTLRHGPSRIEYTWEQRFADPVAARVINAMHFRVTPAAAGKPRARGGARPAPARRPYTLADAFVYDWRLWTIAELREAMAEAGFGRIDVYDRLGEAVDADGNVYVRPLAEGEGLDENWVVYVAGRVKA